MFESFLKQHDSAAWDRTVQALLPSIHEVDRNATRIWFRFFPLELADAFAQTGDPGALATKLRLDGNYRLADQSDTSHWFLYGHRYWPQVKDAIARRRESTAATASLDLASIVRALAKEIATTVRADESLLVGIAAVGLMTLRQVASEGFGTSSGAVPAPQGLMRKSPAEILAARQKDDRQGLKALLSPLKAEYSVTFDERRPDAKFPVIIQQHLTTGSANDTREYPSEPRRCHEGPIPVECRTASCGTCWIGVLAGAEKLSAVELQETRLMKDCGYVSSTDPKPLIRLACQSTLSGNVTVVVPPWNGFLGKGGLIGG